jgi:1-phosphatidylinositol-4-phosphate 5-kinase
MPTSHEVIRPSKAMPFLVDGSTSTSSSSPALQLQPHQDADRVSTTTTTTTTSPVTAAAASNSPPRPHRTQSATALHHGALRLPPTVPEENKAGGGGAVSIPDGVAHVGPAGSPRRARASTGVTKPRASTERLAEEDANYWAEEIHKRREIRRRWKEAEDESTVIIGNKVDRDHPNYVTAYNMLTGLRVAVYPPHPPHPSSGVFLTNQVSRVSAKVNRELTDEDFKFRQKFTFDKYHSLPFTRIHEI